MVDLCREDSQLPSVTWQRNSHHPLGRAPEGLSPEAQPPLAGIGTLTLAEAVATEKTVPLETKHSPES